MTTLRRREMNIESKPKDYIVDDYFTTFNTSVWKLTGRTTQSIGTNGITLTAKRRGPSGPFSDNMQSVYTLKGTEKKLEYEITYKSETGYWYENGCSLNSTGALWQGCQIYMSSYNNTCRCCVANSVLYSTSWYSTWPYTLKLVWNIEAGTIQYYWDGKLLYTASRPNDKPVAGRPALNIFLYPAYCDHIITVPHLRFAAYY